MRLFSKTSVGEAARGVMALALEEGHEVTYWVAERDGSAETLRTHEGRGARKWSFVWRILKVSNGCFVDLEFRIPLATHIVMAALHVGIFAVLVLAAVELLAGWPPLVRLAGGVMPWLVGCFFLILVAGLMLRQSGIRTLSKQQDVLGRLERKLPLNVLSPSSLRARRYLWVNAIPLGFEVLLAAVSYKYCPLLGFSTLAFILSGHLYLLGAFLGESNPGLGWRSVYIGIAMRWQRFVFIALMVLFVALAGYVWSSETPASPEAAKTSRISLDRQLLDAMGRQYPLDVKANPVKWNLELLRSTIDDPDKRTFKDVVSCAVAPLLLWAVYLCVGATGIMSASHWKYAAVGRAVALAPCSGVRAESGGEGVFGAIVWIVWAIGSLWNWLHILVCFSLWSWIVSGSAWMWPQLAIAASWLKAVAVQCECELEHIPAPFHAIWTSLIAAIVLPGTLLIALMGARTVRAVMQRLKHSLNRTPVWSEKIWQLERLIDEECAESGVARPKLQITRSRHIGSSASWRPLSRRGVINLTVGAVERLDEKELRALMRHEIAHLKFDCRKLGWLRFLSYIGGFPYAVLTSAIDSVQSELRADSFAVRRKEDSMALRSALTKAQVMNGALSLTELKDERLVLDRRGMRFPEKWRLRLTLLRVVMWEGCLLPYSYPQAEARRANLRELADMEGVNEAG